MNAVEIEQAISDFALQPFDLAEFPFAFGIKYADITNGASLLARNHLLAPIGEKA
jgi:hypothetical protein